jgi:hypothetical protein
MVGLCYLVSFRTGELNLVVGHRALCKQERGASLASSHHWRAALAGKNAGSPERGSTAGAPWRGHAMSGAFNAAAQCPETLVAWHAIVSDQIRVPGSRLWAVCLAPAK